MQPNKVPFLYNFSPSVVAPPLDFSDWIRVTGYWFLDEGGEWEPPQELQDFITKARADKKKLVYVGFGSIIVNDPAKMTQEVIDAVQKADVRCILSKGWSDRISSKEDPAKPRAPEPEMPPEIHVIKSAPHDWLFRQIDAAAHHGGSGTTGASLRAGIPTIIRPFFGDQYFFASRVEDLGVGVWVKKWGTNSFGRALWEVTRNERMIVKARVLGEQIRSEGGVENAIQCIYRDLEYAKSLIKRKAGKNEQPDSGEDDDTEESWTFVGRDEPDPDIVTKKLSEGLAGLGTGSERSLGSQVQSSVAT
ncbi:Sterol 3-beta-glucosyltransferase [Fusarium kuroshium]|uniref:Sterol 3-beta-glucosyltransferase n=3 Tax=Fusarium solani species complex TaxID=232080 RepID=A0A3M2S563_9HYPO|nr:Sterol 3-beta-glucosyltransferase [Fusarium kuroshium]